MCLFIFLSQISNTSELSVEYYIKMDSQSLLRYSKAQETPFFIKRKPAKYLIGVYCVTLAQEYLGLHDTCISHHTGTQNNNGQQVFDCVPANGVIPPGSAIDIVVTFAPDHPSDFYSDGVRIDLFGQEEQHVFQIKGMAKPHIMYLAGGDEIQPEVESLSIVPEVEAEEPGSTAVMTSR